MKKLLSVFILLASLISANAYSQAYPLPKVTLQISGGYGTPLGDFKTDIPATTRADDEYFAYYTKQLVNFGATGKLSLGARGNARITFGITDNIFTNNTNAVFTADADGTLVTTNFKPKVNVLSVALGGEYAFSPTQKVNPYIGAQLAANFFSGDFTFGQTVFVKDALRTAPMDMKSETRIGLIFDGGMDFRLSPQVGANIGLKYHLINLIGAGADNEAEVGPNEIDLGDKAHVDGEGNSIPARSVSSISGYAGVTFFFGLLHK